MSNYNLQKIIDELAEFLASQDIAENAEIQVTEDLSEDTFENLAFYSDSVDARVEPCAGYADYDDFKRELKTCIESNAIQESLFYLVEMHLKEKGLKPSEVYKSAQISKQDFSRYVRPEAETISRTMVFNLAIGLKLNSKETKRLLRSAGYGYNKKNKFDIIVMFCIDRELYDVTFINMLLDEFEQPLLKTYNYREN